MKIEGLKDWEATGDSSDVIKLMKMTKILSHKATDQKYHTLSLYTAIKIVYRL